MPKTWKTAKLGKNITHIENELGESVATAWQIDDNTHLQMFNFGRISFVFRSQVGNIVVQIWKNGKIDANIVNEGKVTPISVEEYQKLVDEQGDTLL